MLFCVLLLGIVVAVKGQELWSPCPEVFEYVNAGRQYVGLVKVLPRGPGEALKVTVVMYITAQLPSGYAGKLSRQSDNEITSTTSNTVNFHLDFPSQNPLPTIASISVNGENICVGQEVWPRPSFLTTSTVSFTIFPPTIIHQPPSNYPTYNQYDTGYQQWSGVQVVPTRATTVQPQRPPQLRPVPQRPAVARPNPRPTPRPAPRSTEAPKPTPRSAFRPTAGRPVIQPKSAPPEDCGLADVELTQPLIHNGIPTQKGDWPWLAAIYFAKNDAFFCAGNLVDLTHVVTAAHCLQNKSGKKTKHAEIYVMMGKFNLKLLGESGNQRRGVSQVIVHERYNFTSFRNDIAILTLDSPVDYTRFVRPICLWRKDFAEEKLIAREALVVGWGRDANGNMNTEHPEMAKAPIVSLNTCRQEKSFLAITNEMTLCAGHRDGSGPCTGDSGGGLMLSNKNDNGADLRYYLQGVVSVALRKRGVSECNLRHYAVYTNVNKYLDWLRRFIVETYADS